MKKSIFILFVITLSISCKQKTETKPLSIAEKIANAHGFEHWQNVSEIQFTFAGNRSWTWQPKSDDITLTTSKDTLSYNRKSMDSVSLKADRAFINDKFWLLIPFQLVWDDGITTSEPTKTTAPISNTEMNKITLTYSNEGGYTPGDAYDFYFGDEGARADLEGAAGQRAICCRRDWER